jgi:hypothetical protein
MLYEFCAAIERETQLLFVVNQVNALDPTEEGTDLGAKRESRTLLDRITAHHLKMSSSSSNYRHTHHEKHRQTGERRIHLYGGLSKITLCAIYL